MPRKHFAKDLLTLTFVVGVLGMFLSKQETFAGIPAWNEALILVEDPSGGVDDPSVFVYRVEATIFGIAGATTFLAIILSGVKYMAARSDAKATMQAKKALTYSIVGLFLVVSTYTIRTILLNLGN